MSLFQNKYRIESIRLKGYDYSTSGFYFITICTKNRVNYFGEIYHNKLIKKPAAKIVKNIWFNLSKHYPNCLLDVFVIMPNHIHGIIFITDQLGDYKQRAGSADNNIKFINKTKYVETGLKPVSTKRNNYKKFQADPANKSNNKQYSLSEIIRAFKTFSAREINKYQNTQGQQFWQSRFYDHIIRNEKELEKIREYIINNPVNWENNRNKF